MCTLIIYRNIENKWPCIIASNRDELFSRSFIKPDAHWNKNPYIIAGKDNLAGGSWLGINKHGLCVAILNRRKKKQKKQFISRGNIVLKILSAKSANNAKKALEEIELQMYESFNLVIADKKNAFWIKNINDKNLVVKIIPFGVSMIDAFDLNDSTSERIAKNYEVIKKKILFNPNDWITWKKILTTKSVKNPNSSISIDKNELGFGTVSSSLIALPNKLIKQGGELPLWMYTEKKPTIKNYTNLNIEKIFI